MLRTEAFHEPGWYDLVHSHYWLSGQVGWLVRDRWRVPLVHSAHTLAKVKNSLLAEGDSPEPKARIIGEEQVVAEADRLITFTEDEAAQLDRPLRRRPGQGADRRPGRRPRRVHPGRSRRRPAARLDFDPRRPLLLFVGRIQPLKAPDVLLHAAARLTREFPLQVAVVGAPSGVGARQPALARRSRS